MKRIFLMPVRLLWKIFSRMASVTILPFSALAWVLRLMPWISRMAAVDVVVLMTAPTGFAHSLSGPDMLRHLYPGKRCIFFIASWKYEHNYKVGLLWKDVDVVCVPRFITAIPYQHRVIAIPFLRWHDTMVAWLTQQVVSLASGGRGKFQKLKELHQEALSPGTALMEPLRAHSNDGEACGVDVVTQLQLLQMRAPAPPIRLPEAIRNDIVPKLEGLWRDAGHGEKAKICCLYLRFEKRESYTTRLRNSSPLEDHLPAVRLLNEAGYQVLLTGDFEIDSNTRESFKGDFVEAKILGIDNNIYQLFAATEAEIFIGTAGGGDLPAVINAIPSLYLNWFPYSHGRRNSWVYFKSARDEAGQILPGRQLITDFVRDAAASFGTLIDNTQEEITDAVACFIEDVKNTNAPDPYADIAALIPQDTQFHLVGTRLSPAWVRRNIPGEDVAMRA